MIEFTGLSKSGGPLTKRIYLDENGKLVSNGSACVMSRGGAKRLCFDSLSEFADLIHRLEPFEAIAVGSLRADLPDQVQVTTQDKLAKLNGAAAPDLIARNGNHISYTPGRPALALIDIDTKGMPPSVEALIKEVGGFWAALVTVLPGLADAARVVRRSTSAGISRTDTGEALPSSNGMHVFLHVQDGADIERFLRTLHDRCWLAGFGWHMVGAGGQLLDRSLVDRMVAAPERLVFEGAPVLDPPLAQDQESRRPKVVEGEIIATMDVCPPLTLVGKSELNALKAKSAHDLAPAGAAERQRFVNHHADKLAKAKGFTPGQARRIIERQCDGILLPDVILPWDDEEFAGCTVADVLADPARFVGATMADPLEGPDYGRTKAMVMRRPDGSPWINSFAHGRTVYELKFDAAAVSKAIATATPGEVLDAFVHAVLNADLDVEEHETLRDRVHGVSGVGKRAMIRN